MSKLILYCICATALLTALPARASSNRVALVIGNRDYKFAALENPLNDARDIRSKLEKLGFDVIYRENAELQGMESAIEEFGESLSGRQVGLFYYSGHGIQYEGENYLIPVNNQNISDASLKYKALNVGLLLDTMKKAAHPVSIVILDACRDNPFRGFRNLGSRGLANVSGPAGSIIAFATAPGSTAADGIGGRNGTYTGHLLANLDTPDITIEELFKRVRRGVSQETGQRQITWENSSLNGDFCFVNCPRDSAIERAEMQRLQEQNRLLEERLKAVQQQRQNASQADSETAAQQKAAEQQLEALLQQNRDLQNRLKSQEQTFAQRREPPADAPKPSAAPQQPVKQRRIELPPAL